MYNLFVGLQTELVMVVLSCYVLVRIWKIRLQSESLHKFWMYAVAMFTFTCVNLLSSAIDEQFMFCTKPSGFVINILYMILICGGSYNWLLYVETVLGSTWTDTALKRGLCYLAIGVFIILCLSSYNTGLVFTVDDNGIYARGPLWFLEFLFCYVFMFVAFIKAFLYTWIWKRDYGKHTKAMVANSLVGFAGFILQIFFTHSYIAVFATVGMVISYIELCTPEEQELLEQQSTEALLKEVQRQKQALQKALDDYKQADYDRRTDFLTGLHNRQDMYELLQDSLSGKRGRITAIFMLDIDNFKRLNDNYGHAYGDQCLKNVATTLIDYGKSHEMIFYRYGGEEILGISFGDAQKASSIAEALVLLIEELDMKRDDSDFGVVTISLGYTTNNRDYVHMIDMANEAMNVAKAKGKNRSCCYETM